MKKTAREDVFGNTQQMLRTALRRRSDCHFLTHAALVLMAVNRRLTPHDAFMDACQMFCHILKVKWRSRRAFARHGGKESCRAPARKHRNL